MSAVRKSVVGLHVGGVAGMVTASALQLAIAPRGPLKRLKWVWLPTVASAAGSGLVLVALHPGARNWPKLTTKIGLVLVSSALAARYHTCEQEATPSWLVPSLVGTTGTAVAVSVGWK
jgi:peptidoglycan/LPS O-acetylase OafA/YrhL